MFENILQIPIPKRRKQLEKNMYEFILNNGETTPQQLFIEFNNESDKNIKHVLARLLASHGVVCNSNYYNGKSQVYFSVVVRR